MLYVLGVDPRNFDEKEGGGAQTLIDKTPIFLHSSLEVFLDNYQLVMCDPVIATSSKKFTGF